MPTCDKCGGEIIFRYVGGLCTPIHLSGGCWSASGSYYSGYADSSNNDLYRQYSEHNNVLISNHADENYCRPTRCPRCGLKVYFIRHNGGSVWVDSLGWPWPKHTCFDNTTTGDTSLRVLRGNTQNLSVKPLLGLVIRVKSKEDPHATSILGINAQDGKGKCLQILGNGKILIGQLVALDLNNNKLQSPDSISYKILQYGLNPENIDLSRQWLFDCWNKNNTQNVKEINNLIKCPECNAMLKPSRLAKHLRNVHKIEKP